MWGSWKFKNTRGDEHKAKANLDDLLLDTRHHFYIKHGNQLNLVR